MSLLNEQMRAGLHTGYQVYCSMNFEEIVSEGAGISRPEGTGLTAETMMLWMSAGKPVTAVAIAQLWEKGLLDLDDAVAKFIPEFGENGKEGITLRHCLTHTAGFRGPLNNFTPGTWEEIIARICRLKAEGPAGERAAYHAGTSWFILGEIVQRLSGMLYSKYVRERIFLPLGMRDCWIGMPAETYRGYGERLAVLPNVESGKTVWETAANTEVATTIPRPGANGRGPMRQLGRFYEMLLKKGEGVLSAVAVDAITSPHRVGMWDASFGHKIDFGLGFLINSNHYGVESTPYQYGPYASSRTFGHSGNQSSVGFADPEKGMVVCLAFNGLPGEVKHQGRVREVLTVIYEELGLV
ncbi:MAG TPA: serine hydrolase domain-containing protein [Tepidisphaeraceae bacterium]|nr:serine hydrolase domain-containing protein [Tepidisphaeraceae bacterium]